MFTLYYKEDCEPCVTTKEFLNKNNILYKTLNIKDNEDGTQYGLDEKDNKIELQNIIKIFPILAIGNDFLFGETDIIRYFNKKYINLIEDKYCPEVSGKCQELKCKKYSIMSSNGGLHRGNCNDNWHNILLEENRNTTNLSIKKLDKIIDLLSDLSKSNIIGTELITKTVSSEMSRGFTQLRKDNMSLHLLTGNKLASEKGN